VLFSNFAALFKIMIKNVSTLWIAALLFVFCVKSSAQSNPFMPMAEQRYAEYSPALWEVYYKFYDLTKKNTTEARKVISQLEEVAHKTGHMEWKLIAALFECEFVRAKKGLGLFKTDLFPPEEVLQMETKLLEEAVKANVIPIELSVRQRVIDYYWYQLENYEQAFELYAVQDKRLDEVSSDDIPEKADYLKSIADAYYYFKDYELAMVYFKKVLEEKDHLLTQSSKQHSRNGLGLCYCCQYKDFDRSDSCYRALMNPENFNIRKDEYFKTAWTGIAEGNLGYNMFLRGEYDKAIPLLKSSLEKMLQCEDYIYSSATATNLANIYFKKGKLSEVKRYIDLSFDCNSKVAWTQISSNLYKVLSKYHAAVGNGRLAIAYMDSASNADKQHDERFNAAQLLRVKQRQHLSEQQLKDQKLHAEILRNKRYRQELTVVIAFTVLSLGLLLLLYRQYRKRNAAYHALVVKTQQWAHVPVIEKDQPPFAASSPDTVDMELFNILNDLMTKEHLYRNRNITLEQMAKRMDIHRNYLSQAINRCAGMNFNIFINEFRVKEAVQIISANHPQIISIETIAFDVGFNDRQTFYRAFKKFTGLSPAQFRDNLPPIG